MDGSRDISFDLLPSDEEPIVEYSVNSEVSARTGAKTSDVEKPANKKYFAKISKSNIKKAIHSRCMCRKSCMKTMNKLSHSVVKSARRCNWSRTPHERRKWLNEQFQHSHNWNFQISNGPNVCQVTFYTSLGINRATFYKRKNAFQMGVSFKMFYFFIQLN